MQLHDKVAKLRRARLKTGTSSVPDSFQGVTKTRIRQVLRLIDLGQNPDIVDTVFALLDDQTESLFSNAPEAARFSSGATTDPAALLFAVIQRYPKRLGKTRLYFKGRDIDLSGLAIPTTHRMDKRGR
jgi:hypothetical protein